MIVTLSDLEAFLDDISTCFITRDYALWRNRIILPFSLVTRDGPVVLDTEAQVKENFQQYLVACDAMSLNLVSRRAISIEDCADGTWLGTYETRLISMGLLATRPYTATALLLWDDGVLRCSSILNARGHHEWTGFRPGRLDAHG